MREKRNIRVGEQNRQRESESQQGAEERAPCTQQSERGSGGKKERKTGVTKSWGRREKRELDMGLCAASLWVFLLICVSQAELGRVWAREQEGKSDSRPKQVFPHVFTYLHIHFVKSLT